MKNDKFNSTYAKPMLTYLGLVEYLTYLDMQLLLFPTLSLFWPFKVTSPPKTLLALRTLSFHRQFFSWLYP